MRCGRNARRHRVRDDARGLLGGRGEHVAPLILAERPGEARRRDLRADAAPKRHLRQRHGDAAVGDIVHGAHPARRDQSGDELAVAPFGGEIDRRRRAVLAAATDGGVGRAAEPAGRPADQQNVLAGAS